MKWRLLAVACGVIALGLLLYPLMGELVSKKYHSDVEAVYTAAIRFRNERGYIGANVACEKS